MLELVTLYRKQVDGTDDAGTVCTALSRARLGRTEGDPRLALRTVRFHLKADEAGTPAPKPDDAIKDGAGVRYRIDDADTVTLGTRYQCNTTQEVP